MAGRTRLVAIREDDLRSMREAAKKSVNLVKLSLGLSLMNTFFIMAVVVSSL